MPRPPMAGSLQLWDERDWAGEQYSDITALMNLRVNIRENSVFYV